ncbi:MAG: hypothetical protein RIC06_22455 [Cyclobacteriaceae bacterium]
MFTGSPEYIRHVYKVNRALKSYTIYELVKVSDPGRIKLPEFVRIEPFRGKSNTSGVDYLLRGRESNKWANNTLTGLRNTSKGFVYYGDRKEGNKKNFLVIKLDGQSMIIDYYNSFYPGHPGIRDSITNNY